jgi:nucleoside-diphosphate-sugar epimerase
MILITGGSGLIGSELICQLLEQGKRIKAIYNKTSLPEFNNENVTTVKCDILDTVGLGQVMEGVTHVYHCAAIVSFDKRKKEQIYAVNIDGTTNVVNASLNAGVKKIVHVSSVAALGRVKTAESITEEIIWTGENRPDVYGRSKFLSEMEVWRGIGEGLRGVIVNPSLVLGGTDWNKGSTKIFKTAFEEFPWYTDGITGFVDARDVARAMILLMDSEITNERFILNAENVSYKDVFTEIANSFGKRPPHKKVTPFIAALVWRTEVVKSLLTGKEHLLDKETAHKALAKVYFNNSKIKKSLREFSFRPIKETIHDTCKALQKLNNL